ncbi:hypothetical protein GOBAR_DD11278 [Gossypium barbadense]|nr:hypothetical protein GOBAR_DD11278 [Gossypium barbadense]
MLLFELMKEYVIEPSDQHYASLVNLFGHVGCLHGNIELATYIVDRIFELVFVSLGLHALLSNVYTTAGR